MARRINLSLIFILCFLTLRIGASAPLAPEDIKNQVKNSSTTYYKLHVWDTSYTYGTEQVAKNVLAHNSVDTLLGTYSIETIFSWNNGIIFIKSLQRYADETTKIKLSAAFKIYVQKQLKAVWLDDIFTVTTPSTLHAINDYETSHQIASDLDTLTYKQHLKQIAPLLCTIIKEEKNLSDQGYIVFFHSQRWEYLFGEKLYTDLWALTNNKKRPTNYLFAHVRITGIDPEEYGKLSRTEILKNGCYWGDKARGTLLFATNSLFGNYKDQACRSALSYFLRNFNEGDVKFERKDIFTHYKLSHLYAKHEQEIAVLETYYNAAGTFGTMLRIAIPKTMIRDYCFRTWGGTLRSPNIDIYTFLEDLKTKPQNNLNNEEFCIVMLDEAMNPEGRILIKAYHCAEQTEWQKFEDGYEKLIQKLAAEIN